MKKYWHAFLISFGIISTVLMFVGWLACVYERCPAAVADFQTYSGDALIMQIYKLEEHSNDKGKAGHHPSVFYRDGAEATKARRDKGSDRVEGDTGGVPPEQAQRGGD